MGAVASIKYGTRYGECFRIYDNDRGFIPRTSENVKSLVKKWESIEQKEFDKRKNGKALSKIIMLFPNEWKHSKKEYEIHKFLKSKFSNNHNFTFCFHRGKNGEAVENSHGHLYYSERIISDPKYRKDPAMSKLGFIKHFIKDWNVVCSVEHKITKNKTSRIPMMLWKKNPEQARKKKKSKDVNLIEEIGRQQNHLNILRLRKIHLQKKLNRLYYHKNKKQLIYNNYGRITSRNDKQYVITR